MRSALYLAGNKTKLIDDILPHLDNKPVVVDVFAGSATVALNVISKLEAKEVLANEGLTQMHQLHKWLRGFTEEDLSSLKKLRSSYGKGKEEYERLKADFNKDHTDMPRLYLLMCRGFSNMIRFSPNGDNNVPWGDRDPFFPRRIMNHSKLCKDIQIFNHDFGDFLELLCKGYDLKECAIYLDPPYLGTTACYNEGEGWTEEDNFSMMDWCKFLAEQGAKVVMSNIFENKGFIHQDLIDWCKENEDLFEVHHLNRDYSNCSWSKSVGKTREVLIVSR